MNLKLNVDIARSLLMARWRQTMVAAIGVTFSITMFIALLGFMTGLNQLFDDMILNRTAHVRLYNEIEQNPRQPITNIDGYRNYYHFIASVKAVNSREEIYNSTAIVHSLRQDKRVQGIAPKIHTPAFFNYGNVRIAGAIDGVEVQAENRLFHFNDYVSVCSGSDLAIVPNSIILGKALAEQLMVTMGDLVYITTPTGDVFPLKLVGYYQSGFRDMDKIQAYTSIGTAQKILAKPANYVTDLQIKLNAIEQA